MIVPKIMEISKGCSVEMDKQDLICKESYKALAFALRIICQGLCEKFSTNSKASQKTKLNTIKMPNEMSANFPH